MSDAESDDGRRAAKKRKASRACDRCNSQHQPCDNATPKCSVCVRAGTDCTYNRPIRKRGPRSGYTGQNGERLLAIVLQARPDIEDIILHALRAGTYADTGIPNLDYYRNNENQADLVSKFNESRLGRFLQNGETPDLNLLPIDQEPALLSPSQHAASAYREPIGNLGPSNMASLPQRHNRAMSSSSGATSSANPHGAPQNPGDIYLQSEDIRRRISQEPGYGYGAYALRRESSHTSTPYGTNGSVNNYPHTHATGVSTGEDMRRLGSSPKDRISYQVNTSGAAVPQEYSGIDAAYTTQWLDSVPTDTLLNLGFALGESMEADFFELCANPDPIDSTPTNASADQDEDEEAVWRRLVMKGRFI
ncbi:hypothetical protein GGR57DRAFT_504010 [Xylariaceae sp. FL1272]|nr:hypothetical protein GGR57DRAFT_504010 [Xylariaceae sp. FL1272]